MIKKVLIGILLVICLWGVFGGLVSAAEPLVQCGRTGTSGNPAALDCDFVDAVDMINRLITWLIIIAAPISAGIFAYAGWLYLSAGDNSGQVSKAKTIFIDVGIGFIIVLSGWLVFKFVADTFIDPDSGYGTYLN